ncbi:CCR4-NOT transcription complex, subunit 3 [Phytophthora oleae]|uniref:CCR4-NOT transcription complex, subunit 3 n=1 Tax=Phytophthora oleae TaxID=2107226 RepID=A0ABD3FWG7_9STRA
MNLREDKPASSEFQMAEVQAKAYVAELVRRLERDSSERNYPPDVRYDSPQAHLDCEAFILADSMVSENLNRRMLMSAQTAAWTSELPL